MTDKELTLKKYTENYIFRYYPETKQKSDNSDWLFWTSYISTYTDLKVSDIGKIIYESSGKILENISDLETEVSNLTSQYNYPLAWSQLIKIGVRIGWVQKIKEMYYKILLDDSITTEKLYYYVKENFIQLPAI